jgi:hypothetical protein
MQYLAIYYEAGDSMLDDSMYNHMLTDKSKDITFWTPSKVLLHVPVLELRHNCEGAIVQYVCPKECYKASKIYHLTTTQYTMIYSPSTLGCRKLDQICIVWLN